MIKLLLLLLTIKVHGSSDDDGVTGPVPQLLPFCRKGHTAVKGFNEDEVSASYP